MEGLPERFRALRKQRGLSSTALAEPRYSVSYVSQIERGLRRPSRGALEYFAHKLKVSPSFLETGVPDDLPLRLRYALEEAEREYAEGSYQDARQRAEEARGEAEPYELAAIVQWAWCVVGDCLYRQGYHTEAAQTYERLLGQHDLSRPHRIRATAGLARASRAAGDLKYAGMVVESFLAADHDPPLDHAATAELESVLVSVYFERGDVALAQRAAERALKASDESVPIRTRAIARHHAAAVLARRGQWEEALSLAHEARTLMQTLDDRRAMAKLYTAYAFLCLEADPPRVDEALSQLDRSEALMARIGGGADLAYVYTERGRAEYIRGRYDDAARWAERATATEGVLVLERARALLLRGKALRALDRLEEARESLREALAVFEVNDAPQQSLECWGELAEIAAAEGDYPAAVEAYRAGVAVASGGGRASLIF